MTVGTVTAVLVAIVLSPPAQPMTHRPAPGWSDLLGAQWPSLQHALRAGLGVMLVPWDLESPGAAELIANRNHSGGRHGGAGDH